MRLLTHPKTRSSVAKAADRPNVMAQGTAEYTGCEPMAVSRSATTECVCQGIRIGLGRVTELNGAEATSNVGWKAFDDSEVAGVTDRAQLRGIG